MLIGPALPAGHLRSLAQPRIEVDHHLALRPWRAADAPAVRAAFDCPDIQRWHVRRMDGDDEARDWTARWAERWAAETDASWAVVDGADRVVGQVGLRTVLLAEASAQVSYWTMPRARGTGVAVRATRACRGAPRLCQRADHRSCRSCGNWPASAFGAESHLVAIHRRGLVESSTGPRTAGAFRRRRSRDRTCR
ncbi:GNAT family N-acetyltransferase [Micromonospora zhanjiangensis]|uniref:GNAT family N-acetyltransferase n=1 Tax=Micromonospora zhanjiangensis TaxID=1522057 RepID=A0ABV8KNL7_9ACTN